MHLHANVLILLWIKYSPEVLSIWGGETRYFLGSLRSESYWSIPTYLIFGNFPRSNLSKVSNSNAFAAITIRSARKLNVTTASSSTIGPIGWPILSIITKGGKYWSFNLGSISKSFFRASPQLENLWGASPFTCASYPFFTMLQSFCKFEKNFQRFST